MLLIWIASTNVLLLLMILTAKVNCQLGQRFEPAIKENQNKDVVDVAPLIHKLSGRQPDSRLNFDLSQYNLRNAPNPPGPIAAGAQGPGEIKIKVNNNGNGGTDGGKPPPPPPPSSQPGQEPVLPPPLPPPAAGQPPVKLPSSPPKPGDPSGDFHEPGKDAENDEKMHDLQRLVQELYVAQAQVQLEANEIQRAQGIAAAAQQALEEAANNVRMITAALHAAQQTVASAAIRAQTAQLQLAAHDQLLFAARQKVDALSSQIVSIQAEVGIQPTKLLVDLQALLNKLKEPLSDTQKPTPVPSILGGGTAGKGKETAEGKTIHSVPGQEEEGMDVINFIKRRQESGEHKNDESIESLLARSNDLIHYSESLLHDNFDVPYGGSHEEEAPDGELKKELNGLDENEVKSLINFIVSLEHKQDEPNDKQLTAGILGKDLSADLEGIDPKIIEKSSNQKYINDFLDAIKNSKLKRDGSSQKSQDKDFKDARVYDYFDGLKENLFKPRRAIQTNEDSMDSKESDHIFNMENAFYVDSENFRDSQP